jgi:membrane protease YdiL (CAAX protease family)
MPWDFVAILLVLGLVIPLRGRAKMRTLLALPEVSSAERLSLYASTIAFQWAVTGIAAWRAWARGLIPSQLGITALDARRLALPTLAGALFFLFFQWWNLRRVGRSPTAARATVLRVARLILPATLPEKLAYVALAVTAGVCEEFLYRGFATAAFLRIGLPNWAVVVITAALFGLAHLYQGRNGVITTLLVGLVFGAGRIVYDSLAPVVIWHATVDLTGGLLGRKYVEQQPEPTLG